MWLLIAIYGQEAIWVPDAVVELVLGACAWLAENRENEMVSLKASVGEILLMLMT